MIVFSDIPENWFYVVVCDLNVILLPFLLNVFMLVRVREYLKVVLVVQA